MANLTEEEQSQIESVIKKVADHPGMIKHKRKIISVLGSTIGADYHDDRAAAEEEYLIAIWRAAVSLLYHKKYSFECRSCKKSSYITKSNKQKPFDRQYPKCPSCDSIEVVDPGDTHYRKGQHIVFEEFQESYSHFTDFQKSPTSASPIKSIAGKKQYENPGEILNDSNQLVKFFGEFAWNYFKQHIKENKRAEQKREVTISGPPDEIIVQEITALCVRMKAEHHYCEHTQSKVGVQSINCNLNLVSPEFSLKFAEILQKAKKSGITIKWSNKTIQVFSNHTAPFIERTIKKSEHILIMESQDVQSDDQTGLTISQISYRTVGAKTMHQEDHTQVIDAIDVMEAIRESLPDGDCKDVFDIYSSQGSKYLEFSEEYGDGKPAINHIANHLSITARTVKQHRDIIKINMLAHGMHGIDQTG
mgnify:CR=1 FL=1|tara:strand:+ start:180 stop:1436 length:1257 start_codon:yes stop_codon:yes gene_type:complete